MKEMGPKHAHNQTISGIVVPSQWDEAGNIIGLTIQSFNEIEYLVERRRTGQNLHLLLHKKVQVVGRVKEQLDGKKTISIRKFKLMENRKFGD
jgi:hypothetical protein